ncbi:unnamed protein product [Linum trigynum]|uniref:Uncharacterized protein n=1 Tax=Linum trigynum TaxID=586398 RepID=A0AAV2DUJ6_9ROSI
MGVPFGRISGAAVSGQVVDPLIQIHFECRAAQHPFAVRPRHRQYSSATARTATARTEAFLGQSSSAGPPPAHLPGSSRLPLPVSLPSLEVNR